MEYKNEINKLDFEYLRALKIGGLYELIIDNNIVYFNGANKGLCHILQMVSRYIEKANFIIRYSTEEIKLKAILDEKMQSFW